MNIDREIETLIRARYPILYLVSSEEMRVQQLVLDIAECHQYRLAIRRIRKFEAGAGALNTEIIKALSTAEMKDNLSRQGTAVYTMTPDELGNWLRTEIEKWSKVVKAANLKLE